MTTTTYVDANLHHDQVTGKAVTACLHIVNATPSHGYTKRQATVETATYGSEFVGQVRCFHEETSRKLLFWTGDTDELNDKTKGSDRIPTKKSLV